MTAGLGVPATRVFARSIFEMETNKFSEQRLLQASADLLNQLAEVQRLREAIQSAEARGRSSSKVVNSLKVEHRPVKSGSAAR